MNEQWVHCVHNSSYSFIAILLKLYRCLNHDLKMCMWFEYNPEIIFHYFFPNLNSRFSGIYTKYTTCILSHLYVVLISKTCPCNVYPLKTHFYVAKMGFAGVYLVFLFLLQNINCGYSLEPPRRGDSNVYPKSMF